jgi:hypothetical protein
MDVAAEEIAGKGCIARYGTARDAAETARIRGGASKIWIPHVGEL